MLLEAKQTVCSLLIINAQDMMTWRPSLRQWSWTVAMYCVKTYRTQGWIRFYRSIYPLRLTTKYPGKMIYVAHGNYHGSYVVEGYSLSPGDRVFGIWFCYKFYTTLSGRSKTMGLHCRGGDWSQESYLSLGYDKTKGYTLPEPGTINKIYVVEVKDDWWDLHHWDKCKDNGEGHVIDGKKRDKKR